MNAIYVRRARKVVVPAEAGETPLHVIVALQKNIESLGFLLSPEVCDRLTRVPVARMESFYKTLVAGLREMVGAHREFRPMYPNFPAQVMELSAAELYLNAIRHYWTNRLLPYVKLERLPFTEATKPKLIELGSREDFERLFTVLVASKTSISPADKADVIWFVEQYREQVAPLLPTEIPNKENLAVVGAALWRATKFGAGWLGERVKTATDALRLAVALSGGDVSLAEPTKFLRFSRAERRALLSWIERGPSATEDMLRWKDRWIRLGERLHPGEYQKQFPKAAQAFDILRNDRPFPTFNAAVEAHLRSGKAGAACALLQSRPGELTRRLDHLLRAADDPAAVQSAFGQCAASVSTPVLLQAMAHFARRAEVGAWRTFFPKGEVGKVQVIPNKLPALPAGSAEAIAEICRNTLRERFAKLPALGKCFLDPELTNYLVPFSQRSAAKALRTLVRGSRLPLPEAAVLRFFIWWRNGTSRTDIDLSAALYDDALKYIDVVSYYNLKTYGGCHSGDIVDAPQGAAEFIDLDLAETMKRGIRYIVMSINSYTMQPYCDLPECFAGWMARHDVNSGEIFEARTVQDKVDVASKTQVCLPAVFDLVERKVIWADIALQASPYWNNVANNLSGVSLMLRAILTMQKPTLHDLFSLHIQARGSLVSSPAEADTVFSVSSGTTPFDIGPIVTTYL